jgi:hypothetical protein
MASIELQLDEETLERARQLAQARHCTLEQLLKEILEQLGAATAGDQDWALLTAEQFLKGYAPSDAIYDDLPSW